jgi:hypothetical protein
VAQGFDDGYRLLPHFFGLSAKQGVGRGAIGMVEKLFRLNVECGG